MTVLAIAHRAGNSLAGLRAANELGVDVVELDLRAGRQGPEVRHLKSAGPLPFLWDTWALASASAPRLGLAELLLADRQGTTFMLDLKGRRRSVSSATAVSLHELGHARPVLACGRWWPSVEHLAALHPFVQPVFSARTRSELASLSRRLTGRESPPYGVSVHASLVDRAVVRALRRHVSMVMTWPVNDRALLARVVAAGVTGVISDEPTILAEVVARRDGRRPRGDWRPRTGGTMPPCL